MNSFTERLTQSRHEKGASQLEIAKLLNVSRQAYAMYESGSRKPDIESLSTIADYLDVSTDYLLGRTDNPYLFKHDLPMPEGYAAYTISKSKEPPPSDIGECALEFAQKNAIPVNELKDEEGHPIDLATWLQSQIRKAVKEELQKQADPEHIERDNAPQQDQK